MKNHIDSSVKLFLEKNKDIIDDLPKLYEKSLDYSFHFGNLTPLLTKTLLNAGINPLESLSYIPDYYMSEDNDIEIFEIPENIVKICQSAFEYCKNLKFIEIPKYVEEIEAFAFSNCFNLKNLTLNNPNIYLGIGAFENDFSTIKYNGTYNNWLNWKDLQGWEPNVDRLICNDKIIAK